MIRPKLTVALTMVLLLAGAGVAFADDKESGEKVFKRQCSTCHTVEAGKNKVGPSLKGVIGRKAASIAGFKYSQPMKDSNIVWSDDKLDAYLADPKAVVPKGSMVFVGLKKEQERKDLIAYLKHEAK
jgi:cytochrome c